jgi:hypothetical protein
MQWPAKQLAEPDREVAALMAEAGAFIVGANTISGGDVACQHTLWFEILRDRRSG